MIEIIAFTALLFLAGHFVADYPLQGEFLSSAKFNGPLRVWHLFGHSAIHAGVVALISGSLILGLLELVTHMAIDEAKIKGKTSFATDQFLHVLCKIVWITLLYTGVVVI